MYAIYQYFKNFHCPPANHPQAKLGGNLLVLGSQPHSCLQFADISEVT